MTRPFVTYSVSVLALLSISGTATPQQTVPVPSITVGTTIVKLGMANDTVIEALSSQFIVKPDAPNCKTDNPLCRTYTAYQTDNSPICTLQFDRAGKVVKATVERLPGFQVHEEGSVGAALVTALTNFVAEGLQCSIQSTSSHSYDVKNPNRTVPSMIFRQAIVECGTKRLRILSTKSEGHPDSLQLTEEIGCPSQAVGSCEK